MPGVTAKDIAEKLNISQSAVSLALNGKPGVSENTRALVLETAMQLGYSRPDSSSLFSPAQTICFVRYAGKIVQIAEHTSFASFGLQGVEARATELYPAVSIKTSSFDVSALFYLSLYRKFLAV